MNKGILIIFLCTCYLRLSGQTCTTTSYSLSGYSGSSDPLIALNDEDIDLNWKIVQIPSVSFPVSIIPKVSDLDPVSWTGASSMNVLIGSTTILPADLNILSPNSGSISEPEGIYIYETEFCLSPNASEISLNLQVLADNRADIYLNGTLIVSHDDVVGFVGNNGHQALINYTETNQSLFILGGQNILQIHVTNYDASIDVGGGQTKTGLCVFSKLTVTEGCVNFACSQVPVNCDECVSFEPIPGQIYWMSAWVKVDLPDPVKTYNQGALSPKLALSFESSTINFIFYPTGEIIDGWQRIVGKFEIPPGAWSMDLTLHANAVYPTYFDDIRIHPFNASMKSYVYDGETFWLVSELDDNNYATFYEYDEEGGLIRIKKETARGIVTIQETRSSTIKQ